MGRKSYMGTYIYMYKFAIDFSFMTIMYFLSTMIDLSRYCMDKDILR